MGAGCDLYGLKKDGSEFPVKIGLNSIETAQGTTMLSAIVDTSDRKRLLDTAACHTKRIEMLHQLDQMILDRELPHQSARLVIDFMNSSHLYADHDDWPRFESGNSMNCWDTQPANSLK
jgi:hypothetical protein